MKKKKMMKKASGKSPMAKKTMDMRDSSMMKTPSRKMGRPF